jgi:hypothetical protein
MVAYQHQLQPQTALQPQHETGQNLREASKRTPTQPTLENPGPLAKKSQFKRLTTQNSQSAQAANCPKRECIAKSKFNEDKLPQVVVTHSQPLTHR